MAVDTIDPYIVTALKLLHSSASDSAEKMRAMLDSEISKNHDKSKLISNLLTKKQLNDEKNAPGSGFKKQKPKKAVEEVLKAVDARPPSPEEVIIDDDSSNEKKSEIDDEMDYTDYTCVTCRQIDSSANNQLFECIECNLLMHQLCHIPKIPNETHLTSWVCSACKGKKDKDKEKEKEKESVPKSTKYESSSSSCSSSSRVQGSSIKKPKIEKKVEPSKKKGKESSSSSSSSRSRSSKK